MCGRVKHRGHDISPGSSLNIKDISGIRNMIWGTPDGYYNARSERLYTTWKKLSNNKCILEVEGFKEGDGLFLPNYDLLQIGCINNGKYFFILTTSSNDVVKPFHHRMPLIVNNYEDYFLNEKVLNFSLFNQYELKLAG